MMLPIAVEVACAVCGTDCSMFSQTADRLTACRILVFSTEDISNVNVEFLITARLFTSPDVLHLFVKTFQLLL